MGHSAFAQTHKGRKMGFNDTHLLIANVGQIINVLHNKARERERERWTNIIIIKTTE